MAVSDYVVRAFRSNRRRNALGVASVVVSVCLMVLVGVLFNVALVTFSEIFTQGTSYDIRVTPPAQDIANLTYLDASYIESVLRGAGVEDVHPLITQVVIARENGSAEAPLSFIVLYGAEQAYQEGKVRSLNGSYDIEGDRCVLSKEAATTLNVTLGSEVQAIGYRGPLGDLSNTSDPFSDPDIARNLTVRNWTVAGVLEQQGRFIQGVEEYAVKDLGSVQAMYSVEGRASTIVATVDMGMYDLNDPQDPAGEVLDLAERIALRLGPAYVVTAPRAQAIEASLEASRATNVIAYVFSVVFPTISGILIASILNLSVEERAKDLAVMRLLGARRRMIGRVIVGELALMLALGVPIGLLLGVGLPYLAHARGVESLPDDFSQVVDWGVVAGQVTITLAITSLFAIQPLRKAMATSPAAAVYQSRGEGEYKFVSSRGVDRRLLVGAFLLFVALVYSTFFIPYFLMFGELQFFTFFIFSFLVILLAYCVWMLAVVPWAQRGVLVLLGPLMGPTRKLLRASLERYVRRNAATTLIFSIIVAIMLFFSSFFAAISGSIERTTLYEFGSDIRVIASGPVPVSVVEGIERSDFASAVAAATTPHRTRLSDVVYPRGASVDVRAVRGELTSATFASADDVYRGDLADIDRLGDGDVVISRGLALELRVGLGDTVVIDHGTERLFLEVRLLLESLPGFGSEFPERPEDADRSTVLVAMPVYAGLEGVPVDEVRYDAVYVHARPGTDLDQAARQIQQRYRVFYEVQAFVPTTLADFARDNLEALNALFYVILTILLLVALFSLVANLLASVLEREYELGVVRALGLRGRALRRMLMAEGATIALTSMLVGIAVGTTLSMLVIAFFNMLSPIDFAYEVPWASLAYLLVLTVLLSVIGTYSPARSVSRRPVVELMRRAT